MLLRWFRHVLIITGRTKQLLDIGGTVVTFHMHTSEAKWSIYDNEEMDDDMKAVLTIQFP